MFLFLKIRVETLHRLKSKLVLDYFNKLYHPTFLLGNKHALLKRWPLAMLASLLGRKVTLSDILKL